MGLAGTRTGRLTGPRAEATLAGNTPPAAEIAAALRAAGVADVGDSVLQRALYSSDASLYRVVPRVVAWPHDGAETEAALAVCRALHVPLTCRGAGTSIAGNAIGPGVVLDFSRHMRRVTEVDPDARLAVVQPGVVQAQLQRAAAPFGLRFGPDPSTHDRCTIGGMIGNNSCGARSLRTGRTADNVLALDVLTAAGGRLSLGSPAAGAPADPGGELALLRDVVRGGLATIRTEFGRFGRQVSGYSLEHLLPEHGFDVRRFLVGSEGTLGVVTSATVRLVGQPACRVLVVLGYPDMPAAADAAPDVLRDRPAACEGMDSRLVDVVRERRGASRVPDLPAGSAWLFVEVTGDTMTEALSAAHDVVAKADAVEGLVVSDPAQAAQLWRIREDGAGLAGRTASGAPAYPGWEDSAVPVEAFGPYLRELNQLLDDYHLSGVPYGHFGEGCLHLRLDFPLGEPDAKVVLRGFMIDAAHLVARYGGSLSGEHGDGRARSELLPLMYSPRAVELFEQVKHVFDAGNLLNPGVLVKPAYLDDDVRAMAPARLATRQPAARLALAYPHDGGDFGVAVHRCSGVGRCVAGPSAASPVMCPSFQATRDEKDSTRGRARILQEMVNGQLVTGGWRAPEVLDALDLCLSCKACSAECPAGVDMAAYKSEVLHQAYRRRLRPRAHYTLGGLPRLARLASRAPGVANALTGAPGLRQAVKLAAGIDGRRSLPRFAPATFRAWFAQREATAGAVDRDAAGGASATAEAPMAARAAVTGSAAVGAGRPVLLLVDTFTNHFSPEVGQAAVAVLEAAGCTVQITERPACCGLTWISTGQLGTARRMLRRTAAALRPALEAGTPIVGLEPSCTAVFRSDAADLLDGPTAAALAGSVRTLSEFLLDLDGWQPPALSGVDVLAQPHCHHRAVMTWAPDAELLRRAGASVDAATGCCGLAGNFGVERGHYDVSVAVAETALLPAVRDATPGTTLLADGFSCRTQLTDLTGRDSLHLAQLLAPRLRLGAEPGIEDRSE
jgi:FAD/FMN-containing dehydrogenase/Fe-S oxidoreductase